MVAPMMNSDGVRNIYLPKGDWVDFWTGERCSGEQWVKNVSCELEIMPVYVRKNANIPMYPEPVHCTDQMDMTKVVKIVFDERYKGISSTVIGEVTTINLSRP